MFGDSPPINQKQYYFKKCTKYLEFAILCALIEMA